MKNEKLISQILLLAIKISQETVADVSIQYSGHVDSFSVHLYLKGWVENEFPDYQSYCEITPHDRCGLKKLLKKLEDIYANTVELTQVAN